MKKYQFLYSAMFPQQHKHYDNVCIDQWGQMVNYFPKLITQMALL
jgi:hypothetical protein